MDQVTEKAVLMIRPQAWVALANAVHAVPHTLHIHVDTHDAVISVYACLFDALRSSQDREARASLCISPSSYHGPELLGLEFVTAVSRHEHAWELLCEYPGSFAFEELHKHLLKDEIATEHRCVGAFFLLLVQ